MLISVWYNDMLEQTVAKNERLSKSWLGFFLTRQNQTYIITGNTAKIPAVKHL